MIYYIINAMDMQLDNLFPYRFFERNRMFLQ